MTNNNESPDVTEVFDELEAHFEVGKEAGIDQVPLPIDMVIEMIAKIRSQAARIKELEDEDYQMRMDYGHR